MASTGKIPNDCLNQKRTQRLPRLLSSCEQQMQREHGPRHLPSSQSRDALPRRRCPPGRRGPDSVPCPRQSSVRRALCNRPARPGRHRHGPSAGGSLARSLFCVTSDPCTCYRPSPSLPRVGPAHRAPRAARCLGARSSAPARRGEAGRRPQQAAGPPHAAPPSSRTRGSAARPAPRPAPAGPAPASAALSRAEHRTRLSPRIPARLTRAVAPPLPPPLPEAWAWRAPRERNGGAGPGAERRRGRNRPRAWSAQRAFPFPQAAELAGRLSPCSSAASSRGGAARPALLTGTRERRDPGAEGRTAAKPETDTAAILGPARCGGGGGREPRGGTARGGRGVER